MPRHDIWFTSDTHFGHKGILSFDSRPWVDIDEHDQALIERWNARVGPHDTVFHLGDFAWTTAAWHDAMGQLNGNITLIRGNHDRLGKLKLACFEDSYDIRRISIGGHKLVLCHYPLIDVAGPELTLVHGHTHKKDLGPQKALDYWPNAKWINAGCMVHEYAPIHADELIARIEND